MSEKPYVWALSIAAGGVATYSILHYLYYFTVWKRAGVPGPTPWPLVGNLLDLITCKTLHDLDLEYAAKYGKKGYIGIYSGKRPNLLITDPELIKEVMIKQHDNFPNRIEVTSLKMKFFSQDLSRLRDEEWKRVRTILSPTFTGSKLKKMVNLINVIGVNLNKKLEQIVASDNPEFEVSPLFKAVTLDLICNVAFGTHVDTIENPENELSKACLKISSSGEDLFKRPLALLAFFVPPLGRIYRLFDPNMGLDFGPISKIESLVMAFYQKKKSDPNYVPRDDFLHTILEQYEKYEETNGKSGLSYESCIGQAVIFLLAGFGTTANLMLWTCYYMALHQDIQEDVFQEMQSVLASDEEPDYEKLSKMTLLDNILHEVLRFNPVFRTQREAKFDTVIGSGIKIKKGWGVEAAIMPIHMDPEIWGDPEVFRPSRFSGEENENRSPYAFNAFGIGPRNCIGMRMALFEVKMALTTIFRKYQLHLPESHKPMVYKKAGFREPAENMILRVTKR